MWASCPWVEAGAVAALDVLHAGEVAPVDAAEVVDLANIGVGQLGGDRRHIDEDVDELGLQRELGQDTLERDRLRKACLPLHATAEDLGEPPLGDGFE